MKLPFSAAVLSALGAALFCPPCTVRARLGEGVIVGATDDDDGASTSGVERRTPRRRTSSISYGTLQCNVDAVPEIDSDGCMETAVPFSSLVESAAAAAAAAEAEAAANVTNASTTTAPSVTPVPPPVTVPCGTCSYVDYADGSTVHIPGGLIVVGRLHFPPQANVTLNTTAVVVQGMLGMDVPEGGAKVKVTLYGSEEQFLYPHEQCCTSSSSSCDVDCAHKMSVGKKPIVVAGGKVDICAVDPTCPSWTTLKDAVIPNGGTTTTSFVVDPSFARCVRPGDDILVTSDTKYGHSAHLKATVEFVNATAGRITVVDDATTTTRTTPFATESGPGEAEFAVEVANLRRDVVFEAQSDNDDDGGHFMIFHTPDVVQTISGVLFKNFGQAGNIGRYPVHFHMCDTSPSVVSKNVIRGSNQRCVVIHSTDNVTIDDNVAYDTMGHCFSLETGNERYNTFRKNLGAKTKLLPVWNGQSDSPGFNGKHQAATFWVRNMENTFIGNIAAGSKSIGWWIEMKDLNGNQLSPSSFRDNVAHSSFQGLNTYKKGWKPATGGVIDNFKAYKNSEGMKFHISGKFTVMNSLVADNSIGIRYGVWNQVVTLEDTLFKGMTNDARIRLGKTCPVTSSGIRPSFNNWPKNENAIRLKNVTFTNFTCGSKTIDYYFDTRLSKEMGDPIRATDVAIVDSKESAKPHFGCGIANGAKNMFMEDHDGTLGPDGNGPGFIVWNSARMKAFLPSDQCAPLPYGGSWSSGTKCNAFCEGVCLRQVSIDPTGEGHEKLLLSNGETSFTYSANENKKFVIVLPSGQYYGRFLDINDTEIIPPSVAIEAFTAPLCDDYVTPSSFAFATNKPTAVPTSAPSVSSAPTIDSRVVVCGRAYRTDGQDTCSEGVSMQAPANSLHEVRCCRDSSGPEWSKKCSDHDVWGRSTFGGLCHELNFADAYDLCKDNGGRLCTEEEMLASCTAGTGCSHDTELIWTCSASGATCTDSVECCSGECLGSGLCAEMPPSPPPDSRRIVCGRAYRTDGQNTCPEGVSAEAPVSSFHEVRCCRDSTGSGWSKKCSDHDVWGRSTFGGQCHELNFFDAYDLCKDNGGRLCTEEEMLASCTAGTGCSHDTELIWTCSASGEACNESVECCSGECLGSEICADFAV